MLRIFLLFLALINITHGHSQVIEDTINSNEEMGLQLVILAWENSSIRKTHHVEISLIRKTLRNSWSTWLNGLAVGGNVNEFTINPPENRNLFFPRYNFSYRLSYGDFAETVRSNKTSKTELEKLDLQLQADSIQLCAEVLRLYEIYQLTGELLKIVNEKEININSELELVEKEFSEGTRELSEYNEILELYSEVKSDVIRARHNHVIAKINLEELLGMSVEAAYTSILGSPENGAP